MQCESCHQEDLDAEDDFVSTFVINGLPTQLCRPCFEWRQGLQRLVQEITPPTGSDYFLAVRVLPSGEPRTIFPVTYAVLHELVTQLEKMKPRCAVSWGFVHPKWLGQRRLNDVVSEPLETNPFCEPNQFHVSRPMRPREILEDIVEELDDERDPHNEYVSLVGATYVKDPQLDDLLHVLHYPDNRFTEFVQLGELAHSVLPLPADLVDSVLQFVDPRWNRAMAHDLQTALTTMQRFHDTSVFFRTKYRDESRDFITDLFHNATSPDRLRKRKRAPD